MRLLNVDTRQLEEFVGEERPHYAILSHTWGRHEVTFHDLLRSDVETHEGYAKLHGCCQRARNDGYRYVWIDTCCIDKSSSAELSEGINSMFQWYKQSAICYVYLADVSADDDPFSDSSELRSSRWFTRGWTLQELLAPRALIFFDKAWVQLKVGRLDRSVSTWPPRRTSETFNKYRNPFIVIDLLSEITRIPKLVLDTGNFSQFCAAARLAWAADRRTTRVEDRAYSLLGLLEVNMPLLYGEENRAFLRLQEEVIRSRDDLSILAWGFRLSSGHPGCQVDSVLAQSPFEFSHCHSIQNFDSGEMSPSVPLTTSHSAMTNIGMQMAVPVRPIDSRNRIFIAILRCLVPTPGLRSHLVVPLVHTKGGDRHHFSRVPGSPPFLIRRAQLFSLINDSKSLFILSRALLLWRLFIKKSRSTQIYLRENPDTTPPPPPWPNPKNNYEFMNLDIGEVISAGFEVASFYPPWITKSPGHANRLILRLSPPKSARFIVVFSRSRKLSAGRIFFAISITLENQHIARVYQGSALEHLMEQAGSLEVDIDRHSIHEDSLELNEEAVDENMRTAYCISFQKKIFGDVWIRCSVKRMDIANGSTLFGHSSSADSNLCTGTNDETG
ncbi:HET-domain-containing protein [Xylariaceae sp. FL0662B]|nr:HET-domain-containing protein [Xylariaceae sp. FL0662B]